MKSYVSKSLITISSVLICLLSNSVAVAQQNCILDQSMTDFPVFRNAFMPKYDFVDPNTPTGVPQIDNYIYRHRPGVEFFTGDHDSLKTTQSTDRGYIFQWVNRCQKTPVQECGTFAGRKGNLPEVNGYRFFFTTHINADLCTRAQLYNSMGKTNSADGIFTNNPGKITKWTETTPLSTITVYPEDEPTAPTEGYINVCYLDDSTGLADKVAGVVFDYEPQDDRTYQQTKALSQYFWNFLKRPDINKEMVLWTNALIDYDPNTGNPIMSASATRNGIVKIAYDDNGDLIYVDHDDDGELEVKRPAHELYHLYDRVSILVDKNDAASQIDDLIHDQQRVYYPHSYAELNEKIYVIAGLGDMNEDQIRAVRSKVSAQNYNGVAIWNNGAADKIDTNGDGILDQSIVDCMHPYYDRVTCLVKGENCNEF